MEDNIFNEQKELGKLVTGISKATSLVRTSYGPAGGNVIVEDPLYPFFKITNDGKDIVEKIKLGDPIENLGAAVVREGGDRAEKDSREGRKTTMILLDAIFNASKKHKERPTEIKFSLDMTLPYVLKAIDDKKVPITSERVKDVATISSENKEIGHIIGELYKELGPEAIIEVDQSNLPETFYDITDGARLRGAKMYGNYPLITQDDKTRAVYVNPKILISKEKIVSKDQLEPIFSYLKQSGINELVIYAEDFDLSVASKLAKTHLEGGFKTCLIKAPTLWKDWLYEDFAAMTHATPIDPKNGKTFKNLSIADFGTCGKLIVSESEVRVLGFKDLSGHIARLKEKATTDDQQLLRISWLQTKVGVLKIGGSSDTEIYYKTKKARDACNAAYLALKDGVIPGGGTFLNTISLEHVSGPGARILEEALKEPYRQICKNMGVDSYEVSPTVLDAAIVIKNAVRNAVSIAGTALTTRGGVLIPKEIREQLERPQPILR